MTNPDTIRAAFLADLKKISGLVTLMGGNATNIKEYVEENEGDLFGAINAMEPPSILLIYQGTLPRGVTEHWAHSFGLVIRPSGSPAAVFDAIVDGVPTGSSLPLINKTIVAGVHPMSIPTMTRRTIPVGENSSFDYWEINTSFVE